MPRSLHLDDDCMKRQEQQQHTKHTSTNTVSKTLLRRNTMIQAAAAASSTTTKMSLLSPGGRDDGRRNVSMVTLVAGIVIFLIVSQTITIHPQQFVVGYHPENILGLQAISSATTLSLSDNPNEEEFLYPFLNASSLVMVSSSQENTHHNISDNARRFQATPLETWRLSSSFREKNYTILHFQIQECPPSYMASTFHLQALQTSNSSSIVTGTVGPRYRTYKGCGYYNASVPILLNNNTTVSLQLFWTSHFRNYQNQLHDKKKAERIKANLNLTAAEIAELLGEERLEYLARHLDTLPGFPIELNVEDLFDSVDDATKQDALLPPCAEIPIADWGPVGVAAADTVSPNNEQPQPQEPQLSTWPFAAANCRHRHYTRSELLRQLAGLRIRYLGDSHGQYENNQVFNTVCPNGTDTNTWYKEGYTCREMNNSFSYGWRFYRGIFTSSGGDMDGLSKTMRHVQPAACRNFLGIGLYNATIIMTPTWLFAYEIDEALEEYLHSIKYLLELCRDEYPDEMAQMVILLQSPTAADVIPPNCNSKQLAALGWRQNHNFRQEHFTQKMKSVLGEQHADGIIPVFEWTLARNWKQPTRDGVHLQGTYYSEVFHLQVAALLSAFKNKGIKLPLYANADDPAARWFVGQPLE